MEERLNLSTNFITPEQTRKGRGLTRKLGELSTNKLLLITETETPEQLSNTAHLTIAKAAAKVSLKFGLRT